MRWLGTFFRRLRQLHPATWVASLLATVVMTLLMVPAGYDRPSLEIRSTYRNDWDRKVGAVYDETAQWTSEQREAEIVQSESRQWEKVRPRLRLHGWPVPCLVRSLPPTPEHAIKPSKSWGTPKPFEVVSWAQYDNWPFEVRSWRISFVRLAVNAFAAILAIAAVGTATEWWIRRRGGLLRFQLIDALCLITVTAVLLGWWAYHSQMHRIERQALDNLGPPGEALQILGRPDYCGPVWLARLAGSEYSLPHFHHTSHLAIDVGSDGFQNLAELRRLPYLYWVELYGNTPRSVIIDLKEVPRLRRLHLRKWDRSASHGTWHDPLLPEHLNDLAYLDLSEIRIEWPELIAEDVEAMLQACNLKRVELVDPAIRLAELEHLRACFPDVELIVIWNRPFEHDSPRAEEAIVEVRRARGKVEGLAPLAPLLQISY
jgi:hypothetical protein